MKKNDLPARFSIVLITKNEAANIEKCLAAAAGLTDDIVIVDGSSTDGTVEICEGYGARVFDKEWLGYAGTKNFGNTQAKYDWILSLDADEVLSDDLYAALKNIQPLPNTVYSLDRITDLYGTWIKHSGWYPDWKIRLFHREDVYWEGDFVHETLRVPLDFQIVKLSGKLYHYSYQDADDHLRRIERYAQLSADEMYQNGKRVGALKRAFAPAGRFLKTFIFQGGFLDGKAGWVIAQRNAYLVKRKYELLRKKNKA